MQEEKKIIQQVAREKGEELFSLACDIFDHPETGGEEKYASDRLVSYLEENGFSVERGVAGLPTAFRAVWKRGEGGPSIGFLLEYDALRDLGHACGHHLQGPACIGAALALQESCQAPFQLVLYGTPDEEIRGGKIEMEKAGLFRDVDVMFSFHTSKRSVVGHENRALWPTRVTFHGIPSHASGSPEKGRSALDAMMLAFHGLEIMREHVKDGSRIHYTVLEGTGAANIVHETAKCHITLRSYDRKELEVMHQRMMKVVEGACMMTETTAQFENHPVYWNMVPVKTLQKIVLEAAQDCQMPQLDYELGKSGGSSDVGNVSWVAPTVLLYSYFCDHPAHSTQILEEGKTEKAYQSMINGICTMALSANRLILQPDVLAQIKEEHHNAINKKID